MFVLSAAQNRVAVEQKELLTSGSSEVNYCRISFDTAWDGMTREVVFRAGGRSIVAEERDGLYVIPWEVLEVPMQTLYVGVRGMKGDTVVLPTVWANLGYINTGTAHGENALPPTPDLGTQALTQVDEAKRDAQGAAGQARADADRAAALAEEASNKVAGAENAAGAAQISADQAKADADRAEQAVSKAGYAEFSIDENGHLMYSRTDSVNVDFKLLQGRLVQVWQ